MKKNYHLVLMIVSVFFANAIFAQLSTRINDSSIVKLGARPVKGDMLFSLSYPLLSDDSVYGFKLKNHLLQNNDYIEFKWYQTDNLVYRIGISWNKNRAGTNGTTTDTAKFGIISNDYIQSKNQYGIVPGAEYHFSKSNIFDIFVGANLFLARGRDVDEQDSSYRNGDYWKYKGTTNTTLVGLGGEIGINFFVANLPLSIGLKYEFNCDWTFGGKTKVECSSLVGSTSNSQTFYMEDANAFGTPDFLQYNKLHRSGWDTNQDIRVVLNFYFD
ncbi:MAG: hypothetical protein ABR968_08225 [Bacteroidales bacterium]|jgi:hypothetical protein